MYLESYKGQHMERTDISEGGGRGIWLGKDNLTFHLTDDDFIPRGEVSVKVIIPLLAIFNVCNNL